MISACHTVTNFVRSGILPAGKEDHFQALAPVVIDHVFSFLDPVDLISVSRVNKAFYAVLSMKVNTAVKQGLLDQRERFGLPRDGQAIRLSSARLSQQLASLCRVLVDFSTPRNLAHTFSTSDLLAKFPQHRENPEVTSRFAARVNKGETQNLHAFSQDGSILVGVSGVTDWDRGIDYARVTFYKQQAPDAYRLVGSIIFDHDEGHSAYGKRIFLLGNNGCTITCTQCKSHHSFVPDLVPRDELTTKMVLFDFRREYK